MPSVALCHPHLYLGKSTGLLETWHLERDHLVSSFDKAEILVSPRPGIHDIKVIYVRLSCCFSHFHFLLFSSVFLLLTAVLPGSPLQTADQQLWRSSLCLGQVTPCFYSCN